MITSAFIVGGMVGAMVGGWVANRMGRKRGLVLSQVGLKNVLVWHYCDGSIVVALMQKLGVLVGSDKK